MNFTDSSGLRRHRNRCHDWFTTVTIDTGEGDREVVGFAFDQDCVPSEPDLDPSIGGEEVGAARPWGYQGAYRALANPDCFRLFGFKSAGQAQETFASIKFEQVSLGRLQVESAGDGIRVATGTPPPAQTPRGSDTVQINTDYNWADYDRVLAENVTTGETVLFPYLTAVNSDLELGLTTAQFSNLLLLHEFRHTVAGGNAPQEVDRRSYNQEIVDRCLK